MSQSNRDKQRQKRKEAARERAARAARVSQRGRHELSKIIHETAEKVTDVLVDQMRLFREKFGREATAEDPLWFDPAQETPAPMSEGAISENAIRIAETIGLRPEYAYAMRKTGTLIHAGNRERFSLLEIHNWDRAVSEYRARQSKKKIANEDDWLRILKE